jgi:hypothetical protein
MPQSPDVLIKRLRNRKRRVVVHVIFVVACASFLATGWIVVTRGYALLVAREGEDLLFRVNSAEVALPVIAFWQTFTVLAGLALGCSSAMLIAELTAFTKDDLLVDLYDRVTALERANPAAAKSRPLEGPATPDRPTVDG